MDPTETHPIITSQGERWPYTVLLKNVIDHPNIEVGDFTYYNDFSVPEDFARTIAPYLHPSVPEKLILGKFVQIAHGAQFITSSANHPMDGFSTYPFFVYGCGDVPKLRRKGDNVVGNDAWIGHKATIMPGVKIGNGAIIAAGALVTRDVPSYAIVAGNPAKIIRMRFDDATIAALEEIAWWDWPQEAIEENIALITDSDIEALKAAKAKL